MNSVVHFEIPVDDLQAAKQFYNEAFGWQLSTSDMPGGGSYTGAITTETDDSTQIPKKAGAINGALIQRDEQLKVPVVTVDVESIDDAVQKVEAAGGRVLAPKQVIEGMGEYAYVTDPSGNVVGLWHDLQK
jgi:uncharacterized protein